MAYVDSFIGGDEIIDDSEGSPVFSAVQHSLNLFNGMGTPDRTDDQTISIDGFKQGDLGVELNQGLSSEYHSTVCKYKIPAYTKGGWVEAEIDYAREGYLIVGGVTPGIKILDYESDLNLTSELIRPDFFESPDRVSVTLDKFINPDSNSEANPVNISGTEGPDSINGGPGDDRLQAMGGDDIVDASSGDDLISDGTGSDSIFAADGDDTIDVEVDSEVDYIDGGNGEDRVYFNTDSIQVNLAAGTVSSEGNIDVLVSIEQAQGTFGSDSFIGNELANEFVGLGGADYLDGGGGMDFLVGGDGDDIYLVDTVDDVVLEEGGIDEVRTGLSEYTLGDRVELLSYVGSTAFVGTGNDLYNAINGGVEGDILSGADGADTIYGGDGSDVLLVCPLESGPP